MSEPLFSSSWYRVRALVPRLRAHTRIHRHTYRGETWHVLEDSAKSSFHRFTPATHHVIGLMDGRRSVDEVWTLASDALGDDAPTQDEMIRLLGQLHASDALQCDVPPDVLELFERGEKQERRQTWSRLISPFAIRVHLIDPERFLTRTLPFVRPLFGALGLLLWLAVVVPMVVLVGIHWEALTHNFMDRVFTPQNLVAVWLLFPVLKIFHELGHGYATKAFGGEVHDMGVMFLVFTPVPYVDASSAWAFTSKARRALVGAGGMIAEVFLAALAFYVWLAAEPGLVRSLAYNVLVIGGATTLLFNANPLLRFDGYYVLSDLIEIPNLRVRSNRYISYLAERYLFGRRETTPPETASGEPPWLVGYSVSAFVYRTFIVVAILFWIFDRFLLAGIVLGGIAAVGWVGVPLFKGARYLFSSPALRRRRGRAFALVGGGLFATALLLLLAPFPLRTRAEGVVWIPDEGHVRSGTDGFVETVVAEPGARVETGDLLIRLRDPVLSAEVRRFQGRVRELEALYRSHRAEERHEAIITRQALAHAGRDLARARERAGELEVRSRTSGTFVLPRSPDLPGRFVRKGEALAWVVDLETITVRAVVSQDDVDLVRQRTIGVQVRLAERIAETYHAEVLRLVPGASEQLPSLALGSLGGGEVPTDPTAPAGDQAVQSLFEVELELPSERPLVNAGGRVYVRFDHGSEALGLQWYRGIRQLFLSRLHV